ncbi:MAG: hypothetical protein HY908_26755 [Myxococcales bacterium]|nr:hypothetical protein [Myxococcales bacterium]
MRTFVGTVRVLGVLAAFGACGCAPVVARATLRQLQARAGFDLGCPQGWMAMVPIDERAKGVMGCGRRAFYLESCEPSLGVCSWTLDGPIEALAPAYVAPPGPAVGPPGGVPTVRSGYDPFGERL